VLCQIFHQQTTRHSAILTVSLMSWVDPFYFPSAERVSAAKHEDSDKTVSSILDFPKFMSRDVIDYVKNGTEQSGSR
jgi:hypothetical protein